MTNLDWTHAMTYEPYGSYFIPDDKYTEFLKKYEDAIVAGYHPHIMEKHKDYGPIVIDFDFLQETNKKILYNNNHYKYNQNIQLYYKIVS